MSKIGEVGRAAFNEAYASLNAAQKEAVDTIEGPVMVIAGPGTGKTQILTLRIANILLKTDTQPENILALTFTDSGAKAMRERLRRFLGADAYRVEIYTFHGLASELIARYPDAFPRIIGGSVATDLEKIDLVTSIIDSGGFSILRPVGRPDYYVRPILGTLSELKREYVSPDDLANIIAGQEDLLSTTEKVHEKGAHKGKVRGEYTKLEKEIVKNKELLLVYRQYEALKREAGVYDFDDMITSVVQALVENEDLLRDLQERFQYIHADEHQDVNGSQNKILELLASYHESPNIFVVGDEKQAIYRFQGASLENFLYFENIFSGTRTISLTENYRSGQNILDAAHSLVAVDDGPLAGLRVPLNAALVSDSALLLGLYSHSAVEENALVAQIQSDIDAGVLASEIAVIVRTNAEVESLTAQLRTAGIAVRPSADSDILDHPITRQIEHLIRVVTEPTDNTALFTVLHGAYWGIQVSDLVTFLSAQSFNQKLTQMLFDESSVDALPLRAPERFHEIRSIIERARTIMLTDSPQRVLAELLQASGFINSVLEEDPETGGRVIRRLYDEIERLVSSGRATTLTDIANLFSAYRSHKIALDAPYIGSAHESVSVMTAHKSKGLEFEVVYLPHLTDNLWGKRTNRSAFSIPYTKHEHDEYDSLDDERRLLYVAITRAKRKLILSASETNATGKELLMSRLVSEIDSQYIVADDVAKAESMFVPATGLTGVSRLPVDASLFRDILKERGFSATSLNNYLRSPWDYVYRNVLRVPEVQPLHMLYGTAVHSVMEFVTKAHTKNGTLPSISEIKTEFERALDKLPITDTEYTQLLEKGLTSLTVYVSEIGGGLPPQTREEMKFRVVFPTGVDALPEIPLTGMLDRVDLSADGNVLRVVDYKTGKPKTRNAIEGKTASDDGGYKRQLVFYALLLSLYDDDRYRTRDCTLSFIEPDGKGKVHEESFTITDDEIAALKKEISASVEAIATGAFLQEVCDPSLSEYCHFAELLRKGK